MLRPPGPSPPVPPSRRAAGSTSGSPGSALASRRRAALLALASPLLVLIALIGLVHRQGSARWQAVPALMIGIGLLLTSVVIRRSRRKAMLEALRKQRAARSRLSTH